MSGGGQRRPRQWLKGDCPLVFGEPLCLQHPFSTGTAATRRGPGLGPQRQATGPFVCSKIEDTVFFSPAEGRSGRRRPSLGPSCGVAGPGRPSAVLATASWIATVRAPHQRFAPGRRALSKEGPSEVAQRLLIPPPAYLRAEDQQSLWTPCKLGIRGSFAALGNPQRGPINLDCAGLRVTRPCKG